MLQVKLYAQKIHLPSFIVVDVIVKERQDVDKIMSKLKKIEKVQSFL